MHAPKLWAACLVLCLLASCNKRLSLKPASSARPYEVIVVGDSDSIVYHALSKDAPSLPQSEPMFDVQEVKARQLDATTQLARNIIVVKFDRRKHAKVSVRHTLNQYAEPQLVVHLQGHTPAALAAYLQKADNKILQLLQAHEQQAAISGLKAKHNPRAEQDIKQIFGIDMLIPADLLSSKKGKNFVWMADNGSTVMRNLCVYKVNRRTLSAGMEYRDSVMKANIKGETDQMYMRTVPFSSTFSIMKNDTGLFVHGLWEMQGDAMGGPFVHRAVRTHDGFLVVEAFVYAPGKKKRNIMRQLEASLYTLKFNNNGR